MEKNRTLVLLGILIVFLLAFGISLWRLPGRQLIVLPRKTRPANKTASFPKERTNHKADQWEVWTAPEVLHLPAETAVAAQKKKEQNLPNKLPQKSSGNVAVKPGTKAPVSVSTVPTRSKRNASVYQAASESLPSSAPTSQRGTSSFGWNTNTPDVSGAEISSSQTQAEKMSHQMAPFLRGLTKEQAETLNRTLNGLSSNVERAIMQALLPKSKKNANIEKYLQKNRANGHQTSVPADPFVNVVNQVSSQKSGIMKSMGAAYGAKAAHAAGKLMDAYQKEMSAALANQEGKSPEDLAKAARAISQKYNDKLEKMEEQYGVEKFKQDTQEKDHAYLEEIAKIYGSDVSAKMASFRDEALQQKMKLAQETKLTTEEAYAKNLEIERELWQKEEDFLISQGYSPKKRTAILNEQRKQELEQEELAQQEGKKVAQVYRMSEKQQKDYVGTVEKMNQKMQQNDVAAYGEQGAAALKPIYDRYIREVQQIIADSETSQEEKEAALQQASQRANQERSQLKKTPEMRELQVNTALNRIMKDPAVQKASPEQRAAFKEHVKSILQEQFDRAMQIEESNLSEQEKKRQLEELQQETQRRLIGQ